MNMMRRSTYEPITFPNSSQEESAEKRIHNDKNGIPTTKEVCAFLSTYSARLLGCGATCIRIEKNISRIANVYDKTVDIYIMPRHVHLAVRDKKTGEWATDIATVPPCAISFNVNTCLSQLSWEVSDKRIDFDTAVRRFHKIVNNDRQNKWLVLLLVTIANASFCRLFNGDWIAMTIVAVATFFGFWLKNQLLEKKVDLRVTVIVCAFVSGVLGSTGILFSIGDTPTVALATSVLYLVPGIPFLNSFSDVLYRHYVCAFSRFTDAIVLTACLSIGLCAAMLCMKVGMF